MNLQSYVPRVDFGSLEPGEIAGLVPFFLGRALREEVAVIACRSTRPISLQTIDLPQLATPEQSEAAAPFGFGPGADQLWLVGHSWDPNDVPAVSARLAAPLARQGLHDPLRCLHISPDRSSWTLASDPTATWAPIVVPDPAIGHVDALAFHACCTAAREAEAIAPSASVAEQCEAQNAQAFATGLRGLFIPEQVRAEADQDLLQALLESDRVPTAAESIYLGVALSRDAALRDTAVRWLSSAQSAADVRLGVWCALASHTSGTARATSAALAALAAWYGADPLAHAAADVALEADADCPLARAVAATVATGIPAVWLEEMELTEYQPGGTPGSNPDTHGEVA